MTKRRNGIALPPLSSRIDVEENVALGDDEHNDEENDEHTQRTNIDRRSGETEWRIESCAVA